MEKLGGKVSQSYPWFVAKRLKDYSINLELQNSLSNKSKDKNIDTKNDALSNSLWMNKVGIISRGFNFKKEIK